MNAAEQYRALVNKLEAIDNPTNESEQLDEIVPAVVAGVAGIASAIKGGSDYLNKIAAAKQDVYQHMTRDDVNKRVIIRGNMIPKIGTLELSHNLFRKNI